jgi:hypothetical protein
MKLLVMQFSPVSRHFIPLFRALFSNTLSLYHCKVNKYNFQRGKNHHALDVLKHTGYFLPYIMNNMGYRPVANRQLCKQRPLLGNCR